MQKEVFIRFAADQETVVPLGASEGMSNEQARRWLDEQFIANECEPLRASGKVLTVDKVLRVTEAAGPSLFADAEWADAYARAVSAALGKPVVRVDVPAMAITY